MKLGLMITGIALSLTTTGVTSLAQTQAKKGMVVANPIVEVREEKTVTSHYVDTDQDGICDNMGTGNGYGKQQAHSGYVDEDQDGICDHMGTGNGYGSQQAHSGYVDADQDGICDNLGSGNGNQHAQRGNGNHHA